jgi:hypothetical protein
MEEDPNWLLNSVRSYINNTDRFVCIKTVACQKMYIDPETKLRCQCNLSKDHDGQCCCMLDGVEIYFNG